MPESPGNAWTCVVWSGRRRDRPRHTGKPASTLTRLRPRIELRNNVSYSEQPSVAQVPYAQLAVVSCRMCGSVPAAPVTFRGHRGLFVMMQFLSEEGPFCRDCGMASFRNMTSRTLVQGWWGYGSFIITPITVLINLFKRGKVANLAPPQPNPYGPSRAPMDSGPRLLQRPMAILGLLIPIALVLMVITLAGLDS